MEIFQHFKNNLVLNSEQILLKEVKGQKISPRDTAQFISHLNLLLTYFCRHPQRIIKEIENLKEDGLRAIISNLHKLANGNEKVWHGNIGEAIATAYVLSCTNYRVPVFKLRLSPNRKMSMHGDDLLGFEFTKEGNPKALLVLEAKNYQSTPSQAVKKATEDLLAVKNTSPTLFDFIINQLYERNDYNKARLIENFLNEYNYIYVTEYIAFVITEEKFWKDTHFQGVCNHPATPLKIIPFLIPNWKIHQESLAHYSQVMDSNQELITPVVEGKDVIEEVNLLLDNLVFKNHQSQLASAALSSDLKIIGREKIKYEFEQFKLENAAKYLTYSAFRVMQEFPSQSEDILKEAATLYERLAIWKLENNNIEGAIKHIIDGAILYSIAGYNANAKVLMEKIINREDIPLHIVQDNSYIFLSYFISGKLAKLQDALAKFFFEFKNDTASSVSATEEEWMELVTDKITITGTWLIARSFANTLQFLRTGEDSLLEKIEYYFKAAANQFTIISDYSSYNLANSLSIYFNKLRQSYTQKIIVSNLEKIDNDWKIYLRLISTLGRFPMMTLWKSQKKALSEGILGDKSLIISMPTSAGKTKTVELAIYKSLKDNPDKICIYVVPSRALASEVEESLSKSLSKLGIGVSILYGGYEFSPFEEDIIQDNQVFVLTPEKLDLIIRNNEKFKNKLSLIIIDEVHDAASANKRSFRTELIFSRLFYIAEKNQVRIICLSAVIDNPSDFAKWISGDENNKIEIEWRPTNQRFGLFEWHSFSKNLLSARVKYQPLDNKYPSEDFYVPLRFKWNKQEFSDTRKIAVVSKLASYYSQTGPTLVFTTTKELVESISDKLLDFNNLLNSSEINSLALSNREKLARACEAILGSGHKLARAIRAGFGYHHGELPRSVRRIVENGVKNNILLLIICTTTLSQGVNLPIKNVIVHSSPYNKLSTSQICNAIGRAGRAGFETEGHIIFCNSDDMQKFLNENRREKAQSFILSGMKTLIDFRLSSLETVDNFLEEWALCSTSQFRKEGGDYSEWGTIKKNNANKNKEEILSTLDSQLLAWLFETVIDEVSDEVITNIFNKMLFSVQNLDTFQVIECFKTGIKNRIIAVKNKITEIPKRKLFNTTGLSINSNEIISVYAQKLRDTINDYMDIETLPVNFWKETFNIFQTIPELSDLGKDKNKVKILLDWIQGKTYKEIADTYFDSNIEKAVKRIESMVYTLPWGLNSLIQHLRFYLGDNNLPPIFINLVSFASNGVSNLAAVYAINLGIHDREIAILIGEAYRTDNKTLEFKLFKEWILELNLEQWNSFFIEKNIDDYRILDCFNKVQSKQTSLINQKEILEFSVVGNQFTNSMKFDKLIIVKYENEFYLSTYDYEENWKLMGENIERLTELDRQMNDLVVDNINQEREIVTIRIY
ncbi:Hachiman antiphage defense system protein HamA [Nostoc sp. UHCC 0251]|jgi:replicative superfamily II helicase|uniref:Hachiman antiphage defense system protein HamA n=1 Tax=Nostoc sp. UHCC 0251 TaxID=3110240 RepID=UPI002B1F7583|nr:Hachiman antiphage defense system protein HamA [Nostoc sp. UHCC 0251]MEA5621427.1 Hachiman antiphage defense system protein HamA [Nostoc sp. UHCC 0251]